MEDDCFVDTTYMASDFSESLRTHNVVIITIGTSKGIALLTLGVHHASFCLWAAQLQCLIDCTLEIVGFTSE